jgi:F-type H+-transporting ATPase subunit epsilon
MGTLHLEVVTPDNVVVSQDVETVVAPGLMGEFGVLEGHVPFLTGLVSGELRYTAGGKVERLAVSTGFSEVSNNNVSILVNSAERAAEIDVERARRALERARERLAKAKAEDVDFARAEAALKRALMRLKVAEKKI